MFSETQGTVTQGTVTQGTVTQGTVTNDCFLCILSVTSTHFWRNSYFDCL